MPTEAKREFVVKHGRGGRRSRRLRARAKHQANERATKFADAFLASIEKAAGVKL